MVEVVQDLLDYVTYAGGVGRRRADAVSGVGSVKAGSHACAFVAEDPEDAHGPNIASLQDVVFDEVLDKPFANKEYGVQLLELSHRGERLMAELAQKYNQVNRLVQHDPLWRSRLLPSLLRKVCEGLRHVQLLVAKELQEVWKITFQPLFYPAESDVLTDALPGGWLDLEDLFLTVHLLMRYLSDMMRLAGDLVKDVHGARVMSRSQIRESAALPEVQRVVRHASSKVPWLGVGFADRDLPGDSAAPDGESPLSEALAVLNEVLMVEMQDLLSDLHRSTYRAFMRVVAAYARWKKTCKERRLKKAAELQAQEEKLKAESRKMRSARSTLELEVEPSETSRAASPSSPPAEASANAGSEPAKESEDGPRFARRRGSVYTKTARSGIEPQQTLERTPSKPAREIEIRPPDGPPKRRGSISVQPSADLSKMD